MPVSTPVATSLYLYAIAHGNSIRLEDIQDLTGLSGSPLEIVEVGELSVVTSRIESDTIRPQRRNLASHQSVVVRLSSHFDVLPVSFGMVADDIEQLSKLLTANQETLKSQLDRVGGKAEMTLVLRWTCDDVFAMFTENYPQLAEYRELIASGAASRDDMIAAGQLFESLRQQERDQYNQKVESSFSDVCSEWLSQAPRGDDEIARVACLIDRGAEQSFEEALAKAASQFDERFAFSFSGPWPTYSFVTLSLSLN